MYKSNDTPEIYKPHFEKILFELGQKKNGFIRYTLCNSISFIAYPPLVEMPSNAILDYQQLTSLTCRDTLLHDHISTDRKSVV